MKKLFLLPLLLLSSIAVAQTRDFTRWVNPFIGTGGHGHTFPGATLPFGMVQLSPDTRIDNWDGSSGYHYSDDVIFGFSHTHLSGTGIPDGCDILVMPRVGDPTASSAAIGDPASSKFSHANEKAEPGYYSVKLDDGGILAELTATQRVGFHRYTFPKNSKANLVINLKWRDRVIDSKLDLRDFYRIEGYRTSTSWAKNQTVYFAAEFSKKVAGQILETPPDLKHESGTNAFTGKDIRAALQFDNSDGKPLLMKLAISFVSIEGARANLAAEVPGWDFDKVRANAKAAWNKELSKIEVSGGMDDQTTIFYTALYHTMIHPNVFNDVDGKYLGHDRKVHQLSGYSAPPLGVRRSSASPGGANNSSGGSAARSRRSRASLAESRRKSGAFPHTEGQSPADQYTVFSLWDTFRAAHPLYTIIDQKRTVDFINTFIRIYEEGGRLPVWELWGEETDTMIGYHAVSVIADAMSKGIEGFDYDKAYKAAKHSAELDHFGLAAYKKRGYISSEDDNESVSKTLEYAYNDWCIAQMADIQIRRWYERMERVTGKTPQELNYGYNPTLDQRKAFSIRSRYFKNLFDPRVDFFVPRKNGGFIRPFAPNEVTFNFTEGNSWVYSFFVPHDVDGLIHLMGGRDYFAGKLNKLFTTKDALIGREQPDITGLIGQYAHGNEPSHHIPYLFVHTNAPGLTQMYVRRIMDEFYNNAPDGLIGNEDCGQMSAWFVLSAAGFYPVTPGQPEYTFGTPLFPEMIFHLENGRTFTVRAKNVSNKNIYVRDVTVNGNRPSGTSIKHADIMNGGVLEFDMTDVAQTVRRTEFPTPRAGEVTVAAPWIAGSASSWIFMGSVTPGAQIYFTLDGSAPTEKSERYIVPFKLRARPEPPLIRFIAIDANGNQSPVVETKWQKRPNDWKVLSNSGYSYQYTGGGDDAIVDGLRGTTNFTAGEWQGYQGKTFEAVIDLQREIPIRSLGGSFLQVVRSWIWIPNRVEFEVSTDGVNFMRVAEIKPSFPQRETISTATEFVQDIKPTNARYVRVRAYNIGKIPSWHPGAGGDPWIFVDEILIH